MSNNSQDRQILSVLQEPLGLEPQPFENYAKRLGTSVEQVIHTFQEYIRLGIIRRFAGIVKHDRAGYTFNAMCAFEVDNDLCDTAGAVLSKFSFITHCYRRTAYPDWPYNIYAMVHARNEQEFNENVKKCENAFKYKSMAVLPTVKEFKKTQYRFLA
jgi:DNA-binding Lrp family transcriptional regulator